MTNWIVGHTDRFKAAVTLRMWLILFQTREHATALTVTRRTFGGDLFERFDSYWDRSP
jgi:dipeptidyl aminopeptidase/acylaminoacyl peptidase